MNTFLNIKWEFPAIWPEVQEERARFINKNVLAYDLNTRINLRGLKEQYYAFVKDNPKRKCKGTFSKGMLIVSKFWFNLENK